MEDVSQPRELLGVRTWIPCLLSMLDVFGESTAVCFWVFYAHPVIARMRGIAVPIPKLYLSASPYLWIPILLATAWGIRMMRTRRRAAVLT